MKVAFLGDRLGLATGGNYYVARLAEELQKMGLEVTLITLVPPEDVPWFPGLRIVSRQVSFTFGRKPGPEGWGGFLRAKTEAVTGLKKLIRERYDILYSVGGPSNIVNHLSRKGPYAPRASVAIIHHLFRQQSFSGLLFEPEVYRKPFQTFFHLWGDILAKDFFVVTVSEFWKRKLVSRGYPEEKIKVIPNGADTQDWPALPADEARKLLGLPKGFVIYTNPFLIQKGVLKLLEALKQMSSRYPDLMILTTGRTDRATQSKVARFLEAHRLKDRFYYAGLVSRDRLPLYYLAADVVALISQEEEGWGLTLLEGMISGKPVICTPLGAMPELVDGIGLVLRENSTKELVRGLEALLQSPERRNQMAAAGPSYAARFSYRAAAEAHLEFFQEILSYS